MFFLKAGTGDAIARFFRRPPAAQPFLLATLLLGLAFCGAGCKTFSTRDVSDSTHSVARLKAGGSVAAEVDSLAQPLIDSGEIHGLAIGVLTPDGQIHTYGYGCTDLPNATPSPNGNTIFQIGSVSKVFLTALLAKLVDEGVLHYDDTVRGILPPEVSLDEEVGRLTLSELALNTGGFSRQPLTFCAMRNFLSFLFTGKNLYAYIDKPYLYDYLRKKRVPPKEERYYRYSNFGYGVLAHLISVKTGRSIEDLLQEKICRPLHLRDTTFNLTAEQKMRLAVGHVGSQPRFMRRGQPLEPWDMGEIMRPAGSLYSTANDLMLFAQANLGLLHHPLEPVLASTHRAQLRRTDEDVAFGWLINYIGDDQVKLTYKAGVIAGYSGYIAFHEESRIAVVVLSNTFTFDEKVGHNLILRLARGLSPSVKSER